MNGWLSNLEMLEILQQLNRQLCQRDPNTIIETINTEK